jgi:prepilin-type N-terminal cleavage/methylation domain-containing protein
MIRSTQKCARRGLTLVELMVSTTIAGLIVAGVLSTFVMFTKNGMRIRDYSQTETQAVRALEMLARDVRMAQSLSVTGTAPTVTQITLTVPDSTNTSTFTVSYSFTGTTFVRTQGGKSSTLVSDVVDGTGYFEMYNYKQALATNTYETQQIKIYMTSSPSTQGLYVATTKRVISARFVMRNKTGT